MHAVPCDAHVPPLRHVPGWILSSFESLATWLVAGGVFLSGSSQQFDLQPVGLDVLGLASLYHPAASEIRSLTGECRCSASESHACTNGGDGQSSDFHWRAGDVRWRATGSHRRASGDHGPASESHLAMSGSHRRVTRNHQPTSGTCWHASESAEEPFSSGLSLAVGGAPRAAASPRPSGSFSPAQRERAKPKLRPSSHPVPGIQGTGASAAAGAALRLRRSKRWDSSRRLPSSPWCFPLTLSRL